MSIYMLMIPSCIPSAALLQTGHFFKLVCFCQPPDLFYYFKTLSTQKKTSTYFTKAQHFDVPTPKYNDTVWHYKNLEIWLDRKFYKTHEL